LLWYADVKSQSRDTSATKYTISKFPPNPKKQNGSVSNTKENPKRE
jgi:hypothetical protein